jgi:hypothetical protein
MLDDESTERTVGSTDRARAMASAFFMIGNYSSFIFCENDNAKTKEVVQNSMPSLALYYFCWEVQFAMVIFDIML